MRHDSHLHCSSIRAHGAALHRIPCVVPCTIWLLVASFALNTPTWAGPYCTSSGPTGERLVAVISDLHFGIGKDGEHWHPAEDFRWAEAFDAFLDGLHAHGEGKTTLVLNGDSFELWQSLTDDCNPPDRDASCTAAEALGRFELTLSEHQRELASLKRFSERGENRVVFVPGNHDAALLFEQVATRLTTKIGASSERLCIAREGYWVSPDGRIFAEHGHQMGKDVNAFDAWPEPFIGSGAERRLQKTWGEAFVQSFYNRYEEKYPAIDNVTEEGAGVLYGMSAEGLLGTEKAARGFLGFFFLKTSRSQLSGALGQNGGLPAWDLKKTRAKLGELLPAALPEGHPLRLAIALQQAGPGIDWVDFGLDGDDLGELCETLEARGADGAEVPRCPRMDGGNLGAIAAGFQPAAKMWKEHLEKIDALLKRARPGRKSGIEVFVYSHTHVARSPFAPLKGRALTAVNTGAWQRLIDEESLETLRKDCGLSHRELLAELDLENLPRCYSTVLLEPSSRTLRPKLRYWAPTAAGGWDFHRSCPDAPPSCPAKP